jgi:hypothetical protein
MDEVTEGDPEITFWLRTRSSSSTREGYARHDD